MATGGSRAGVPPLQHLTVSVMFKGMGAVFHVPKQLKVGEMIAKAAAQFKNPPQGLRILYNGIELPDDLAVGVSCVLIL